MTAGTPRHRHVAGEAEVVAQLAVEEADMLAAAGCVPSRSWTTSLSRSRASRIPSAITKWIPEYKPGSNYFGSSFQGLPPEVIYTLGKLWIEVIMKSPRSRLRLGARRRVRSFVCQTAQAKAMAYLQPVAWLYYEAGKAKISRTRSESQAIGCLLTLHLTWRAGRRATHLSNGA